MKNSTVSLPSETDIMAQKRRLLKCSCHSRRSERDQDGDGKLSWREFTQSLWVDLIEWDGEEEKGLWRRGVKREWEEPEFPGEPGQKARNAFKGLDTNQDGFIDEVEMRKVTGQLHPREADLAREEAEHLMKEADADGDGELSLQEMLDHNYAFYHTAFGDEDDYEDFEEEDLDAHDEL